MRRRIWKTFKVNNSDDMRRLQSVAYRFQRDSHTLFIDADSGIIESDESVPRLRAVFREAGVHFPSYVTDTQSADGRVRSSVQDKEEAS